MNQKGTIATAALTCFCCGCSGLGMFGTGKVAQDIINDATSAGSSLIFSARNAGDAPTARRVYF